MSKVCQICGKGYLKGNQVPRGVGRRVTRRTSIRQAPNLRNKRFDLNGNTVLIKICTSCLKRLKMENKLAVEAETEAVEAKA